MFKAKSDVRKQTGMISFTKGFEGVKRKLK